MESELVRDMSDDYSVAGGNVVTDSVYALIEYPSLSNVANVILSPGDLLAQTLCGSSTEGALLGDGRFDRNTKNRLWLRSFLWTAVLVGLILVLWYFVAIPLLPGWLTGADFRRETRRLGRQARRAERKARREDAKEGYKYYNEKCGAGYYPCDDENDGVTIKQMIKEAGDIEHAVVNTSTVKAVSDSSRGSDHVFEDSSNASATPNPTESFYEAPVFHEVPDQLRRLENREQEAVRLYNKINAERQRRIDAGSETPTPTMPWEQYWSEYKRDHHVDY